MFLNEKQRLDLSNVIQLFQEYGYHITCYELVDPNENYPKYFEYFSNDKNVYKYAIITNQTFKVTNDSKNTYFKGIAHNTQKLETYLEKEKGNKLEITFTKEMYVHELIQYIKDNNIKDKRYTNDYGYSISVNSEGRITMSNIPTDSIFKIVCNQSFTHQTIFKNLIVKYNDYVEVYDKSIDDLLDGGINDYIECTKPQAIYLKDTNTQELILLWSDNQYAKN